MQRLLCWHNELILSSKNISALKSTIVWDVTPCNFVLLHQLCLRLATCLLLALLFDPEDEASMFLRNVGETYQPTRRHILENNTLPGYRFHDVVCNISLVRLRV
jgi:hypothetical protein